MVLPQLVDAPGVDGSPQELVHLVLGVHGLLNATAEEVKRLERKHISDSVSIKLYPVSIL